MALLVVLAAMDGEGLQKAQSPGPGSLKEFGAQGPRKRAALAVLLFEIGRCGPCRCSEYRGLMPAVALGGCGCVLVR